MSRNSQTLLATQTHPGDSTVETITGEKFKGDGYYSRADGLHTVQINLNGFIGTVDIQATLAVDPVDSDWFTLNGISHTSTSTSDSNSSGGFIYNFTGNYVWIRTLVSDWTDGTVKSIYMNN